VTSEIGGVTGAERIPPGRPWTACRAAGAGAGFRSARPDAGAS